MDESYGALMFNYGMMKPPPTPAGGGSIAFVGIYEWAAAGVSETTSHTFAGAMTGGIASTPVEGDVVYVNASPAYFSGITMNTAGFVEVGTRLWRKVMGATPDTSISLTWAAGNQPARAVQILAFRGVDAVTPEDVAVVTSTTDDPGSILPVSTNAMLFVSGYGYNSAGGVDSLSSPDLDTFYSKNAADTRSISCGSGFEVWTGGTFDPGIWIDALGLYDTWNIKTLALRPA